MTTCWVCGRPINNPPIIIGHYRAHEWRIAHRTCRQALGELELDLLRAEGAAPDSTHDGSGAA